MYTMCNYHSFIHSFIQYRGNAVAFTLEATIVFLWWVRDKFNMPGWEQCLDRLIFFFLSIHVNKLQPYSYFNPYALPHRVQSIVDNIICHFTSWNNKVSVYLQHYERFFKLWGPNTFYLYSPQTHRIRGLYNVYREWHPLSLYLHLWWEKKLAILS